MFTIFVFLTEQWARNADSRVDMPSCQLASLGPIPDAVMDEINECILLGGAQDGSEMRIGAGVHDDVASMTCIHSVALCRFGVDTPKGTVFTAEPARETSYNIMGGEEMTQPVMQYDNKVIPHSTPLTLRWLSENYEFAEGVCIPRSVIYKHYRDFCQKNGMTPVNPASFGKIIRQKFKRVKNRRLGTRGYSTYHYYGIGIRSFSVYYEEKYSRNGLNNSMQGKRGANGQASSGMMMTPTSPRTNLPSTTAPILEFPNLQDVSLPVGVPHQLFCSFFTMYRTHCLRVFNFIYRNELDEVKEFLQHFWKGVPLHLMDILGSNAVVNMVGMCDSLLYKSIAGIFVPSIHKFYYQ
ncbi:transcription factor RFX4-like [Cryptotermes secundus]|uniref:transcription factor RFX4-like n=1 Tax=Cryptotermes secundus TaxID=105785 RepID=UPI001454B88A|nr:transcription factor RFX4-like [Cryptotermes secundus]